LPENTIVAKKVGTSSFENIRFIRGDKEIAESYPGYLVDESKISGGHAQWLFFPKNEGEIVSIIQKMKEEKQAITISAARTGIVGSAVPLLGGAVVSLERMDDFIGLGFDEEEKKWFVRVQPNITLNEINEIVKLKRIEETQSIPPNKKWVEKFNQEPTMFYPIDPTEMTASIGGCIAANASGARTFKYGATREWVRRLRVILSTGEVLDIPRGKYKAKDGVFIVKTEEQDVEIKVPTYKLPKAKNAAGLYSTPDMDLIDLFIGSEGIFGFITEADVWLKEYVPHISNVAFFNNEADAIKFVNLLRSSTSFKPEFMEYFDNNALALLRNTQKVDPKFVNMPNIPEDAKTAISFDLVYNEENLEERFQEIGSMLIECDSSLNETWSAYEERVLARFKHFRHAVPELVNNIIAERKKKYPSIHKLGTDMSVEDEYLGEMMEFYHNILN